MKVVNHQDVSEHKTAEEKGQSLLEMAIIVPILLLLLASAVDAGRAFDAYIVLTNAVREGARYATLEPNPTEAQIKSMVKFDVLNSGTNITNMDDFDSPNITVEGVEPIGDVITVTAEYDFPLWFGGIVGIPSFHLQKQAVMAGTQTEN